MRVPLEQLRHSAEYRSLTAKQQKFVDAYITNGYDPVAATLVAYNCKDQHSAKIFSYSLMGHATIIMTLALHFDDDPQDVFLQMLWRMIRRGKRLSNSQIAAMNLYARVKGWAGGQKALVPKTEDSASESPAESAPEPDKSGDSFFDDFNDAQS